MLCCWCFCWFCLSLCELFLVVWSGWNGWMCSICCCVWWCWFVCWWWLCFCIGCSYWNVGCVVCWVWDFSIWCCVFSGGCWLVVGCVWIILVCFFWLIFSCYLSIWWCRYFCLDRCGVFGFVLRVCLYSNVRLCCLCSVWFVDWLVCLVVGLVCFSCGFMLGCVWDVGGWLVLGWGSYWLVVFVCWWIWLCLGRLLVSSLVCFVWLGWRLGCCSCDRYLCILLGSWCMCFWMIWVICCWLGCC